MRIIAEGNHVVDKHPIRGVWVNRKTLQQGPLGMDLLAFYSSAVGLT